MKNPCKISACSKLCPKRKLRKTLVRKCKCYFKSRFNIFSNFGISFVNPFHEWKLRIWKTHKFECADYANCVWFKYTHACRSRLHAIVNNKIILIHAIKNGKNCYFVIFKYIDSLDTCRHSLLYIYVLCHYNKLHPIYYMTHKYSRIYYDV